MKQRWVLGCALICAAVGVASADKAKPAKTDPKKTEPKAEAPAEAPPAAGSDAADAEPAAQLPPHIEGPKQVELGYHAQIDLPGGMILLEQKEAQDLMRKWGNDPEGTVAVIFPTSETAHWWVAIDAVDQGYVSDDDADDLDAGALLSSIKEGTTEQNKTRAKMGIPELTVDDWSEKPHYEKAKHHLVWGLNAHDKEGKSVNFNTRYLGRNGFLSVNVVTGAEDFQKSKVEALAILNAVHFSTGYRYEDHVDSDRDSGVGLKGLIIGGTAVVIAKKTGILVAILLALKKGFIVVFVAIGAFFKRLFGGKKKEDAVIASTEPAPGDHTWGAPPVPPGGVNPQAPPPGFGGDPNNQGGGWGNGGDNNGGGWGNNGQ
jgi:uncharacterized membrane-anchored protein